MPESRGFHDFGESLHLFKGPRWGPSPAGPSQTIHGGHVSFADLQHAGYQPVELLETERCVACVALDGGAMVGLGRME